MILKEKDLLLFVGDSITDCNRERPIGRYSLGNGYVELVKSLLWTKYPESRIEILNSGISGNRIVEMQERWDNDVLHYKPNWVSIMIGINDVWRYFYNTSDRGHISKELFKKTYIDLIERTIDKVDGLILMTPFFVELNKNDPMRKLTDEYSAIVKDLAIEYKTIFVDAQAGFDQYLKYNPSQTLCSDRVHPNQIGHMVIANCFLKEIE